MLFRILITLFISILPIQVWCTDFDNARIIGLPRITCSKKHISLSLETNIPFQGRISVLNKLFIPECNQDYSTNIQKNATFKLDISKCADPNFLRNGSRVLSAHVEIGFHPLVITNNDRIYLLECMDNSQSTIVNIASETANCTHLVRMASKWDSMTEFHVGDAIVHEWSCHLPNKELGKTQTFLTNCNVISQNGQIIHLIDENGCIIDSELMGDVVYNNYVPKLYARGKIFKLLTDEKYRIECTIEFCHRDSKCKDRSFDYLSNTTNRFFRDFSSNQIYFQPPKCAFTREEIIKRFTQGDNSIDENNNNAIMPGNPNIGYDKKVKISTAWLTVRYNQFTSVDHLHERYHLKTVLNPNLVENTSSAVDHFLMGISYREPLMSNTPDVKKRLEMNRVDAARILNPSFQPILTPIIDSNEDFIESITLGSNKIENESNSINRPPLVNYPTPSDWKLSLKTSTPSYTTTTPTTNIPRNPIISKTTPEKTTVTIPTKPPLIERISPQPRRKIETDPEKIEKREKVNGAETSQIPNLSLRNISKSLVQFKTTTQKPPLPASTEESKSSGVRLQFYTDIKAKKLTPTTPYSEPITTTEFPFQIEKTTFKDNEELANRKSYDKFVNNNADWRLDDRAINDSDVLSEKQISSCNNATIISTNVACKWSGVEHLLLIWSFASLIVWMVLIAVCFYRHSSRKPRWMAFREQELRRAAQSRVLGQEHPWLHADAFEERTRSKNEVEINKF